MRRFVAGIMAFAALAATLSAAGCTRQVHAGPLRNDRPIATTMDSAVAQGEHATGASGCPAP